MAKKKIAVEYKNRHLTQPMLDQIVGAQTRTNPDASELIIRCKSAAKTAYDAANKYDIKVTIVARMATPQEE
mgnify:CR=1 FL=1